MCTIFSRRSMKACLIVVSLAFSIPFIANAQETPDIPTTPDEYLKRKGLRSRYEVENNRVVLYYNTQGKLLAQPNPGEAPLINFDEDDLFEIHIVHTVPEDEDEHRYKVSFKPMADERSRLDLLNFVPPALSFAGLNIPTEQLTRFLTRGRGDQDEPYWTETVEVQGPFGAGTYALEIYNVDSIEETSTKLEVNPLKINPLDYFGLKTGVVGSFLTDPESFKIARLAGTPYNTIVSSSGPVRGMPVLNIVVYDWFLHRGRRDKFKDFGGIFPTIGIGLQKPQENFFAGVIWEASSIVSINAGAHFGKVARLSEDFALGEDVLWEDSTLINRTDNTIEFSRQWHVNGYIGATIDIGFLLKFMLR
jgi:hypothetical protein